MSAPALRGRIDLYLDQAASLRGAGSGAPRARALALAAPLGARAISALMAGLIRWLLPPAAVDHFSERLALAGGRAVPDRRAGQDGRPRWHRSASTHRAHRTRVRKSAMSGGPKNAAPSPSSTAARRMSGAVKSTSRGLALNADLTAHWHAAEQGSTQPHNCDESCDSRYHTEHSKRPARPMASSVSHPWCRDEGRASPPRYIFAAPTRSLLPGVIYLAGGVERELGQLQAALADVASVQHSRGVRSADRLVADDRIVRPLRPREAARTARSSRSTYKAIGPTSPATESSHPGAPAQQSRA